MEPKIITRPAFLLAGYAIKTNGEKSADECPALWDRHNTEGWEEKLFAKLSPVRHGEYGVCAEFDRDTDGFFYLIGVEVESFDRVEPDMYKIEIPSATYAVFTTAPVGEAEFSKNIQNTWHYILSEWFPNSDYSWDETKPDFEFYDERCHGETNKIMEIHVPVVKK